MASISARSNSSIPSSPVGMRASLSGFSRGLLHQQNFFHAVDLLELHFDNLGVGGLDGASDIARFDRQLAMSAIDEHQQLHARRASLLEEAIERGADGAAGVQHVVHQDDVLAF